MVAVQLVDTAAQRTGRFLTSPAQGRQTLAVDDVLTAAGQDHRHVDMVQGVAGELADAVQERGLGEVRVKGGAVLDRRHIPAQVDGDGDDQLLHDLLPPVDGGVYHAAVHQEVVAGAELVSLAVDNVLPIAGDGVEELGLRVVGVLGLPLAGQQVDEPDAGGESAAGRLPLNPVDVAPGVHLPVFSHNCLPAGFTGFVCVCCILTICFS